MSNWPEKVWIDTSDTGIEYEPFIDYGVFPAGKIEMPNYIEYTRSDLALPDGLKAELLEALTMGLNRTVMLRNETLPQDGKRKIFSSDCDLIRAAIERLNGVKS